MVCQWVGLDDSSLGHRIYWPKSGKILVERNLKFIDKGSIPKDEQERLSTKDGANIGPMDVEETLGEPEEDTVAKHPKCMIKPM